VTVFANAVVSIALAGSLAIFAAILFGLHRAIARSGWRSGDRAWVWRKTRLVLIVWFAAALVLAGFALSHGASDGVLVIGLGIFVPIVIGVIALPRSETMDLLVHAVPQSWLVGVQFYRVLGGILLVLFGRGQLPGAFALPAGIGDVLVGVLAPVLALADARDMVQRDRLIRIWNAFGMIDLVVAVGTGFLTLPATLQVLSLGAPNEPIRAFSLVMFPMFAVPLAALLHLMSLTKLREAKLREHRSRTSARVKAL
jgi:hypothetical protein